MDPTRALLKRLNDYDAMAGTLRSSQARGNELLARARAAEGLLKELYHTNGIKGAWLHTVAVFLNNLGITNAVQPHKVGEKFKVSGPYKCPHFTTFESEECYQDYAICPQLPACSEIDRLRGAIEKAMEHMANVHGSEAAYIVLQSALRGE